MISDAVLLALVAAIVPTVTVILAWLSNRAQRRADAAEAAERRKAAEAKAEEQREKTDHKIEEVHEVVNSKHAEALAMNEALKTEIRRLNASPGITTVAKSDQPAVVMSADGQVTVSKDAMPAAAIPPLPLGARATANIPPEARAQIEALETEIRRLNAAPGEATATAPQAAVTLTSDGQVKVSKDVVPQAAAPTPAGTDDDAPTVKLVADEKIVVQATTKK